ncbi:fibronectin type III domain-containing protein [Cohnella sp. WQ 127256]|uniref:fibronectin type III domain-containing protein n=1 Tax=Cohnella sp. WQ 127256 TaxID=2938790 RepID=UPI002117E69A
MNTCKRFPLTLLIIVLLFSNTMIVSSVSAAGGEQKSANLLLGDFDTGFESGYSPFVVSSTTTGGSQAIVQINGNPALELRDASLGSNATSLFTAKLSSGALFNRINEIYSMPIGTAPIAFVYEFKLERRAVSSKPVAKDVNTSIQFGNYDNVLIPRFPTVNTQIAGTSAYLHDEPEGSEILEEINDEDLPGYRFEIIPNGGERKISNIEFRFSVRTDTNGTDEAYAIDDLAVYEIIPEAIVDTQEPTAPTNLAVPVQTDTTANLSWSPSTDNSGVTAYRIYQNGSYKGAVIGSITSYKIKGLTPNTAYSFEVKARDGAGNESAASNAVSITTNASVGNLPMPYGNMDIGSVGVAGNAAYEQSNGVITIRASGADIWGRDDSFHYVYRPWTGDGEIIARVSSFGATHAAAKAGVMIRESLSSSSKQALMAVSPTSGLLFQRRVETGGDSTNTSGVNVTSPYWVKLVREDQTISAYSSADGIVWKLVGQQQIAMSQDIYVGLAVSSHVNAQLATATFDQVVVQRIQPEQVVIKKAELTDPTGLYVLDSNVPAVPTVSVALKNRRSVGAVGLVKAKILSREQDTVWEESIPFEMSAFELKQLTIPTMALTEANYYVLHLEVLEEGVAPTGQITQLPFGILHPPHKGVKEDSMFGLGLTSTGDQAIMKQIAQKIGVKWRRGIIAVDPPIVNPSPGVYWGATEIAKARQEVLDWQSYGVSLLGMINYNMSWNVSPGPNGETLSRHQNRPLDMAAHVEMVYNSIAPMQDLVKNWELWNEPWVHGWTWKTGDSQDYRDMTKMIWERVKPEYPDVKLIGGGSTSYQRDVVYAKGSTNVGYLDGSTNHAYGLPDPSMLAYVKLQKYMDDNWSLGAGEGEIWQTELGNAETLQLAYLPQKEQKYGVARTVAPIYLLNKLGAGDTPIHTFWFALSYDKGFSGDTLNIYDGKAPKPAVIAYSTMSHFLEDSELVEELYPQSKSAWGFLFERDDGKATAALYSDKEYKGTLTLNDAQNIKVYDYLGKLVGDGSNGTITVALNPWETHYIVSDLTPQALKMKLTTASFDFEKPLIISPLSFIEPVRANGTNIDIQVENATATALSGQLNIVAPTGWTLQTNTVQVGPLQPGEKVIVSFPATQTAVSEINRYLIDYSFDVYDSSSNVVHTQQGKQTIQVAYAPKKTIAVDGDVNDWSDVLPVTMISNGSKDYLEALLDPSKADEIINNPQSFENVIYKVKTAWDDDYFYFQADVPDENQSSPMKFTDNPYGFAFNSDSVQLSFDTIENNPDDLLLGDLHYNKALGSYMDYLFVGTLAQGGVPELHRQTAPGTNMQTYYPTNANFTSVMGPMDIAEIDGTEGRMKVVRDDVARKTVYEISVAWEAIPELRAELVQLANKQVHEGNFAFAINDTGTNGKGTSFWTKEVGQVQSGAYAFAPFWGTGAKDRGGSLVPRWGFKNDSPANTMDSTLLQLNSADGVYSDNTTLTAVLTNAEGNPISGQTVTYSVVGGSELGSAVTDETGIARLVYQVLLATDAGLESTAIPIQVTFAGSGSYPSAVDQNVLTVTKEAASVIYSGTTFATQGMSVNLAANVIQQQDSELGELQGLPMKLELFRLDADGSRASVSQAVYQTDASGAVQTITNLEAGLYELEATLLPNPLYQIHEALSTIAVAGAPSQIKVNGQVELADPSLFRGNGNGHGNGNGNGHGNGNGNNKLQIKADLSTNANGTVQGELRLKANQMGFELELQAFDWVIVNGQSAYLQGAATRQGETYTVLIMLRDNSRSHGQQQGALVDVTVWKQTQDQQEVFLQSVGDTFNGSIQLRSGRTQ